MPMAWTSTPRDYTPLLELSRGSRGGFALLCAHRFLTARGMHEYLRDCSSVRHLLAHPCRHTM